MRKRIIYIAFLLSIVLLPAQGQTLHAIIFANTEDSSIGKYDKLDNERLKIEMSTIATFLNYKLRTYYYDGQSFTVNNLNKVINKNLTCSSDDIVFFYYTGHGGRAVNDASTFPRMVLAVNRTPYENEMVQLSWVSDKIRSKGARLNIIIGDLCNSVIPGYIAKEKNINKGPTLISKAPCDFYKELFLKNKGYIIAASSEPKETSGVVTRGGKFTDCFLLTLQYMVSENMTADWNTLLVNSQALTSKISNGKQNPVFSLKVEKVSAPSAPAPANTPSVPVASSSNSSSLDDLEASLVSIGSDRNSNISRINLIKSTLNKYFASPKAKVEVIGRDGETVVTTKYAEDYLDYLSIAHNLVNVVKVSASTSSDGRVTSLKVHEMYQK